jgi:RNA polymerase sigma-70 factor (ECF subfamily)
MTHNEIIELILKGDKEKFRLIIEEYQQMVFRTCMGYVHNKDDADDLTQEVFIQAYQALTGFRQESSISTWLYRIAINASLNKVRRNSKNFLFRQLDLITGADKSEYHGIDITDNENPENILIREEHNAWIQKALDSLPENQRTAIVLSKYDSLSQKEIAEIMKTTEGAVEALIQRAKANLRIKMTSGMKKNRK